MATQKTRSGGTQGRDTPAARVTLPPAGGPEMIAAASSPFSSTAAPAAFPAPSCFPAEPPGFSPDRERADGR